MITNIPSRNQNTHRGDALRIISLGGFNDVNQNLFIYEFIPGGQENQSKLLLVDCGVGFPDANFLGVDLVIPDFRYLEDKRDRIVGLVITHGHEDHIGAFSFLEPLLPKNTPLFAPRLAAALISGKLAESSKGVRFTIVSEQKKIVLHPFELHPIHVTHSIPDTFHYAISTPLGVFYHGSDYKFDLDPLYGDPPNLQKIAYFGSQGIKCLLSDSLGADHPEYSLSERDLAENLETEIKNAKGRLFVTTISSNVNRWNQAITYSKRNNRKIVPVGLSVDKIIKLSQELGFITLAKDDIIPLDRAKNLPDRQLTFLTAGFAAQPGSALSKMVMGKHQIKIKEGDKVIFTSPDYIPGTTSGIYQMIDTLSKMGAEVVYGSKGNDPIHAGGHAGRKEQAILINLTSPAYLLPIGGNYRHVKQYQLMAQRMGYTTEQVLIPDPDQAVTFWSDGSVEMNTRIPQKQVLIDGLGVGDVGQTVLRDRKSLSENGVVTLVLIASLDNGAILSETQVITRGFVFEPQAKDVLAGIRRITEDAFRSSFAKPCNMEFIRQKVQVAVEEYILEATGREPLVLPMVVMV